MELLGNPGILTQGGAWGSHPSHPSQDDPGMGEIMGILGYIYCISSIKRPGVYFFRGEIYPAFKRGRCLYGAGVYFSLLAPAPYKLHLIDTELRRSCLLRSCFGHIHSLQLHRYIVRSLSASLTSSTRETGWWQALAIEHESHHVDIATPFRLTRRLIETRRLFAFYCAYTRR